MTTLEDIRTASLLDRAAAVAPVLAQHAARHDVEGTFVSESLDALRDAGLLAAGVPTELGGLGATNRELAELQRELAHHCGSTALATSMHQHVVCFTAWRYRRGLPGAEATLRRVADEGIVLVSTGGGDWTHPRGTRSASTAASGSPAPSGSPASRPPAPRCPRWRRTTTPSRGAGCSTWRCRSPRRASASATTGTPSACAAPPATTWCSTTCSCPTSGCWPTARTASSTRRCR